MHYADINFAFSRENKQTAEAPRFIFEKYKAHLGGRVSVARRVLPFLLRKRLFYFDVKK